MSVSVIIPAYNEAMWLNRTISNIFNTATGEIQVIVVDYGGNGDIDLRAKPVICSQHENRGERWAMNRAAEMANGTHLLRIDAHCDFSPNGWDKLLEEVTGPKDMTQAVLTAVGKTWERIKGHWYERTRLLPTMEAKWEKPNQKHAPVGPYPHLVPNMSSTGCGFMIRKDFYEEIGGANENYPPMGAIGEEFAIKTWVAGGKVQTRTDVVIGHIFGTAEKGYPTDGVIEARRLLVRDFGYVYPKLRAKFADLDWQETEKLKSTDNNTRDKGGVTVRRVDTTTTPVGSNNEYIVKVSWYDYLWLPSEHPDEKDWTGKQLEMKYASQGKLVGQTILYINADGSCTPYVEGK